MGKLWQDLSNEAMGLGADTASVNIAAGENMLEEFVEGLKNDKTLNLRGRKLINEALNYARRAK